MQKNVSQRFGMPARLHMNKTSLFFVILLLGCNRAPFDPGPTPEATTQLRFNTLYLPGEQSSLYTFDYFDYIKIGNTQSAIGFTGVSAPNANALQKMPRQNITIHPLVHVHMYSLQEPFPCLLTERHLNEGRMYLIDDRHLQ